MSAPLIQNVRPAAGGESVGCNDLLCCKQYSPLHSPLYRKIKVDLPAEVNDILRRLAF